MLMNNKNIIIEFDNRQHFLQVLKENPRVIIVKFTATWCNPCKQIKAFVDEQFLNCPDDIICCELDVDINFDLYSCMKKNKQVNGIPVLLAWYKGNISPMSNESVTGTNIQSIKSFFNKCKNYHDLKTVS